MKKLMFFAMAAMVALASCSKTELINTEAPKEIGFKAVTGSITKASETTELPSSMGVYAFFNKSTEGITKGDEYFEDVEFIPDPSDNTKPWTGGEYWPFQSTLDFIFYAPHKDDISSVVNKQLTVKVDNKTNVTKLSEQVDHLYGAEYYNNQDNGFDYTYEQIGIQLVHALSKVTLNLTASNVTIVSITLDEVVMKADYTIDYSGAAPSAPNWSNKDTATDFEFLTLSGTDTNTGESILVVPGEQTKFTVKYKLGSNDTVFEAPVELEGIWSSNTHYIYNLTMNAGAIQFVPSVSDNWENAPVTTPL